jgi:hypothetical protein
MSIRSKGLVFALESETDETIDDSEIAEGIAEVDSDTLDRQQNEAQIDELEMAIEDAMDDVDTLERINDTIQQSVDVDKGLSPEAAEIAEIAVESICNRLGINNRKSFALESFKTNDRLLATRLALEETQSLIKRGWEAVKKAIAAMYRAVVEFINRLFDDAVRLKKTLDNVKAKLKTLPYKKEKENYEDAQVANAFALDSEMELDDVLEHLAKNKKYIEFSATYQAELEDVVNTISVDYDKALKGFDFDFEARFKALNNFIGKIYAGIGQDEIRSLKNKAGWPSDSFAIDLLGRKLLVFEVDKDPKKIHKFKVTKTENKNIPELKSTEVPVLDKEQMENIVKDIEMLLTIVAKLKGKINPKKLSDKFNKVIDLAVKIQKTGNKEQIAKIDEILKEQKTYINRLANSSGVVYTATFGNSMAACRLAMKYINNSMKHYGVSGEMSSGTDLVPA